MAENIKVFRGGGMNTDDAIEFIPQQDYIEAYNARITGTSEGEEGLATNIESNSLIANTLPTGLNKAIGAAGFEVTRKAYSFIYNSQLFHLIAKFDYDTNTQTNIYTNLTDSGNENILPLNPEYYVNDIKLINDYLLAWTDGNNQPCMINLTRLESGGYSTLTQDDFLIIKAQGLRPPTATYSNDTGRSVNLLQGNLFQFTYQYVYLDFEESAWSTRSKRAIPESEATPSVGTDVSTNNNLIVSVDIGTDRVDTVNVGARIANLDYFLVKSVKRDYILALPNAIDIANQVYEAYDPITNIYSFVFYNDGLYTNIDPIATDLDYDHVPLKCETLENINGNQLSLGGITEGYPIPEPEVVLTTTNYNPQIDVTIPIGNPLTVVFKDEGRVRNQSYNKCVITFFGTVAVGDTATVRLRDKRDYTQTIEYSFTSTGTSTNAFTFELQKRIPRSSSSGTRIDFVTPDHYEMFSVSISLFNAGAGIVKSISALKSNSSYQLALLHFDKWGRYFPLATGQNYIVDTQSYA